MIGKLHRSGEPVLPGSPSFSETKILSAELAATATACRFSMSSLTEGAFTRHRYHTKIPLRQWCFSLPCLECLLPILPLFQIVFCFLEDMACKYYRPYRFEYTADWTTVSALMNLLPERSKSAQCKSKSPLTQRQTTLQCAIYVKPIRTRCVSQRIWTDSSVSSCVKHAR